MKKYLIGIVSCFAVIGTLVSCGPNEPEEGIFDTPPITMDHYYSDRVSFADMGIDVDGKTFLENKVEKVKLKSVTDGDTAVFHISTSGIQDSFTNPLKKSHSYVTIRFLAIDTPESTSSIAPWGKKASKYAKSLLENAEGLIIDSTSIDTSKYESVYDTFKSGVRLDSNGSRWLGLVWYCPQGMDANNLHNYRLYQLDVIEECYSFYTGNLGQTGWCYHADKTTEPKLYERHKEDYGSMRLGDVLFEADLRMQSLEKRYTGDQIDENYDYSTTPAEMSIKEALANFDEYAENCKYVALTGVITRFVGVNFYFQDAEGYALYVYMGIDAKSIGSLFSVGDTINVRGRLSEYGGQKQLTDIVYARDTFKKVTDASKVVAMPEPIVLNPSEDFNMPTLNTYVGKLIKVQVKISSSKRTEDHMSKDLSYTVYASDKITDLAALTDSYNTMSIRINGTLNPGYSLDEINGEGNYAGQGILGKTVEVVGIMGIYFEDDKAAEANYPSYQIVVGNRKILENNVYESDFTVVQ